MKSADDELEQEESNDVNQELDELLKECEKEEADSENKGDEKEVETTAEDKGNVEDRGDEQPKSDDEDEKENSYFPDTKFNVKIVPVDEYEHLFFSLEQFFIS